MYKKYEQLRYSINPYAHEKIKNHIKMRSLDGDQSALNNFVVRSNVTVDELSEIFERMATIDMAIDEWEILNVVSELQDFYNHVPDDVKQKVQVKLTAFVQSIENR